MDILHTHSHTHSTHTHHAHIHSQSITFTQHYIIITSSSEDNMSWSGLHQFYSSVCELDFLKLLNLICVCMLCVCLYVCVFLCVVCVCVSGCGHESM